MILFRARHEFLAVAVNSPEITSHIGSGIAVELNIERCRTFNIGFFLRTVVLILCLAYRSYRCYPAFYSFGCVLTGSNSCFRYAELRCKLIALQRKIGIG